MTGNEKRMTIGERIAVVVLIAFVLYVAWEGMLRFYR